MSMNLYIEGVREATVVVKGKKKTITDHIEFELWQTPTKLTYEVLNLPTIEQQVEAYIRWADTVSTPYEDDIYDWDHPDENLDFPVIGRRMFYPAQEHANELRAWLQICDDEDYQVKFYTL